MPNVWGWIIIWLENETLKLGYQIGIILIVTFYSTEYIISNKLNGMESNWIHGIFHGE